MDHAHHILLTAVAVLWLFGALGVWPIARGIDASPTPSLRLLKWTFLGQLTLQALWAIWLAVLWFRDVSNVEHGLILLYIVGSVGWLVSTLAFFYWLIERRKIAKASS